MRLYTPRPVRVQARQLNAADWETCQDIAVWCGGTLANLADYTYREDVWLLYLPAETGGMYAGDQDWILVDDAGWRVLTNAAFTALYQEATEVTP